MKNHQWTLWARIVAKGETRSVLSFRAKSRNPAELPFAIATGSFDFASLRSG
jgi:hypothetical protein